MTKGIRALNWIFTIIAVAALLIAMAAVWAVLNAEEGQAPKVLGVSVLRVITESMDPTIPVGSVIVAVETEPEKIQAGDIITFYSPDPALGGAINTHRVVETYYDNTNGYYYSTMGDAADFPDPHTVTADRIIGKVAIHSLALGTVLGFAAERWGFLLLILIPLAILVIVNLREVIRLVKQQSLMTDDEIAELLEYSKEDAEALAEEMQKLEELKEKLRAMEQTEEVKKELADLNELEEKLRNYEKK
jgi:signal peptidase I